MNEQTTPKIEQAFRFEVWAVRVRDGRETLLGRTNNETGGAFLQGALRSPQWRDPVVRPAGHVPPAPPGP